MARIYRGPNERELESLRRYPCCTICLNEFTARMNVASFFDCDHLYCDACFTHVRSTQFGRRCPICQRPLFRIGHFVVPDDWNPPPQGEEDNLPPVEVREVHPFDDPERARCIKCFGFFRSYAFAVRYETCGHFAHHACCGAEFDSLPDLRCACGRLNISISTSEELGEQPPGLPEPYRIRFRPNPPRGRNVRGRHV